LRSDIVYPSRKLSKYSTEQMFLNSNVPYDIISAGDCRKNIALLSSVDIIIPPFS